MATVAPIGATGAWFTAQAYRSGNSLAAASLEPVSSLSATTRDDGINVRWLGAQTQAWATSNKVTAGAIYTVTRTVDGQNATNIYAGGDTTVSDPYPRVSTIPKRSTLSVGRNVAGAIVDGSLYTWGTGAGLLGTGASSSPYPAKVTFPGGRAIADIAFNGASAAATATDGTVWAWGFSASGDSTNTPKQVPTPLGRTVLSSMSLSGTILQLDSAGTVWRWTSGDPVPISLPDGRRVAKLTQSYMVLATDGTVWSLGQNSGNSNGSWATGTYANSADPVKAVLPAGTSALQLSSTGANTAVLLDNSTVWTAGSNSNGQLGGGLPDGNGSTYASLQRFQLPDGKKPTGVAVGASTIGALASDGTIYMAGLGDSGQLGNGGKGSQGFPVKVYNPDGVQYAAIALGPSAQQSYAVDQNGTYWGWGQNSTSAAIFGNGNKSYDTFPYPIVAAEGIRSPSGDQMEYCGNGRTKNSAGYCALTGDVAYTVSYSYFSWTAQSRSASTTATPLQTGLATVGGPGGSGLCLNLRNNGSETGTPVDIATCNPSQPGQQWSTWSDGTFRANGKCLDMKGNTPGSIVQLWPCNGLGYQWWVPRDDGSMYNPTSGLCLTDPSGKGTPGTQQVIAKCTGAPSEQWKIT